MSVSNLVETDPALQLYEAIIIEKNQKLREKDAEIEQLRQENERLRMPNSNINQQEDLAQRMTQLEENLSESRSDNLQLREQMDALCFLLDQVIRQEQRNQQNLMPNAQNVGRAENKVEKQSGGQQNTSVLILGGFLDLNTIYLLDSKAQRWKKLKITLLMGMESFGAVVLNEEIYIFGGFANYTYQQQDCYKLKNNGSWIKLASLNQKRAFISSSSLVYKGDIWAIGGYSGEYLNSVEKYDISQDKWTYMPEMNHPRCDAAAAVFKDRIFVTEGWNGKRLKSVEMFDPILQKWILFYDLPVEVFGHTMLISNSTLSIFGGQSESGPLNSVWEMDVEDPEKKWTEKQSFKHPRKYFGIGKLSNGIIVFGGCGGSEKTSEIFDGIDWFEGPKLPQELARFAYTTIPRSLEQSFLKKFSYFLNLYW